MVKTIPSFVAVFLTASTAQAPALRVGADCRSYADTHVLVRNDVLANMDAAERNLALAEAALQRAEVDIQALHKAVDELQGQKKTLGEHITKLEGSIKELCACPAEKTFSDTLAETWETVDAPVGWAVGVGMCVGVAWGLRSVQ